MDPVVSFRPTNEERETIERVRRARGFRTRAEAVRFLIREGSRRAAHWQDDPLFRFRIDGHSRPGEDVTAEDVDRELYGGN